MSYPLLLNIVHLLLIILGSACIPSLPPASPVGEATPESSRSGSPSSFTPTPVPIPDDTAAALRGARSATEQAEIEDKVATATAIAGLLIPDFAGTADRVPTIMCDLLLPQTGLPHRIADCWVGELGHTPFTIVTYNLGSDGGTIVRFGDAIVYSAALWAKIVRFTGDRVCWGPAAATPHFGAIDIPTGRFLSDRNAESICAPGNGYPVHGPGWGDYVLGLGNKRYPIK